MIDPALRLLLTLRAKGILRAWGRQLRTKKGFALTLLGLAIFVPMLFPLLIVGRMRGAAFGMTRQVMPIFLLAYCIMSLLTTSASERSILFTPAEIHFLFPAPFTRRQLLAYKVAAALGACLLTAVFMSLFLGQYASGFLTGLFGLVLAMCFLQLFGMVVGLSASTVGMMAHNRRRKVVLVLLGALCLYVLLSSGAELLSGSPMEALRTVRDSRALRLATLPFRPFAEVFTAERLWPDLVLWGALALALDVLLIVAIFLLNARYIETADAYSAKVYARIERLRSSGGRGLMHAPKRAGASLPMPPLWRGVGPIAWRQMMTARRDVARLLLGLLMIGPMLISVILIRRNGPMPSGATIGVQTTMLGMGLILSTIFAYDFRADLDRMAELKALPIAALPLTLGQLVTPVIVLSILQWIITAGFVALSGQLSVVTVGIAALVVPVNMMMIAIDNLWFLLFPMKTGMPGSLDFQQMGQAMLMMIVKLALLGVSGGVAAGLGYGAYLLTGGSLIAAFATAWLVLLLAASSLVPLIAAAFTRFDVAADAPGT
jgi:hypothetical protein